MAKKSVAKKAKEVELIPESQFEDALKKVLAISKEESDEQMADFQASNKARRESRKPEGK